LIPGKRLRVPEAWLRIASLTGEKATSVLAMSNKIASKVPWHRFHDDAYPRKSNPGCARRPAPSEISRHSNDMPGSIST
jgi:hypothetical protein